MKPVMLQNLLDKVLDRSFQQHHQQQQMPQQPQSQQQQQQQQLLLRVAGSAAPTRSDHGNSSSDAFAMKSDHALSAAAAAAAAAADSLDQQQRQHHQQQQQQLLLHRGGSQRLAAEHAQNAKALQQQHYLLQQAVAVQQQQQQQQAAAAAAAAAFGRQALNSRTSGGESGIRSSPYGMGGPQLHQQLQQQQQQQQQLLMPGMGPQHALSAAHHLAATAPVLATIHHAGMPAAFGYDQLMAARQPSPRGSIVTGLTQPQPMPSLVSPPGSQQQQQQQQPFSLRRSPAGMPSEMSPRQMNASRATSHSPAHGSGDISLDHHHQQQQQQRSAATAVAAAWHQQQRRAADSRDPPAISPSSHGTTEPVLRHVAYDQRTPPGYGPLPVGPHGPCGEVLLLSPHQQQQRGPTHQPPLPDAPTRGGPEALHVASSSSSSPPSSIVARPSGSVAFVAMPRPNAFKGFHVTNGNVLSTALPPGALPSAGPGSHTVQQPGGQQRLGMPVQSQGLRAFGRPSHDGVVGYGSGATGDEPPYRRRMEVDGLASASWHRAESGDSPSREAASIASVTSGSAPAKSPAGVLLPGGGGAPPVHSPTASGALHRQHPAAQPHRRSASASPSPTSSSAAAIADVSGQQQQQQQLPVFLHPSSSAAMNAMHQQQQLLLMHGGMAHFAAPYAVAMQKQTTQPSAAPAAGRRLPGSGANAAEVCVPPQRQQQQPALSAATSVAEFSAQQRRTSPPSPAASGSVYRQSPVASHAPARHTASAASADAVSGGGGFGASVTSAAAASRSRSPRGPQQRPSAADEAQPLDLSARPVAQPSPSEALLSSSPGVDDDASQAAAAGDALSYCCRGSAPDDDQPLDLTVTKASPRPMPPMLSSRAGHDPTSLQSSAAPEKDPRGAQLLLLAGGNRPPVDGSGLATVRGALLSQGGGRPALGVYTGSLAASSSDAADPAALGVTSHVTQPSPRRPAATLTAYMSGMHSSDAAVPLLHRNHAAHYGSGSLVSHDTHPLVLDAVAASTGSVRGATLPTMPQPVQLTAAAATVAATGNSTQGFGATMGGGNAGCLPASGGSDPTPATLDGSRNSGLMATSSRDIPSSANAGLSPLGQGQPQPPLSSSVTSLIGSHPLSDILFLHCTRCQSSYGSVHGFRKHFRNAHGHNPSADDVQVQSISATRELVRRQRDAGTAAGSSDGPQQLPQSAASLLVGAKQPPLAFGARVGDAAQHASEPQGPAAAHDRAANGRAWEEGLGGGGSGSAAGVSSAIGSRGGSTSSLLAEEQQQLHVHGSDSRQSPLLQQQQLGALSADRFCLHCLYCGRQYPSVEGVTFEEHVLQHERQLSGGGGAQQQPPLHHPQQQHRDVHTYRCYYCGERAADAGALREHLLQHDELMHFVCSHCAVAYPTAAAASEHAAACHRHHQGLHRYASTSTASRSPLGEEVPPAADFSSASDSSSSGRPTDDLDLVSRLPVAPSLQPPNGLAAYARSRPDANPLFAVVAQPHSHDARGMSKQLQLQAVTRVRHPAEPHWDAAARQQSPAAALPGRRSPGSDPSSQSSSPLSRREPAASVAEQLAPTEADGVAPFGAAGTPKYTAGSRRSRAPYTLAQHIEAAVIRELSKANDGADEATGGSRAEAVVRAAAGVELDQLLLQQQQTTGSTGPTASAAAGSAGSGAGQVAVASLTPYSGGSSGGGSTTVNLMAILDRVVEHGLRSFDTSTAAVTDGAGGIAVPADAVALTQEVAASAMADDDEHDSGDESSRGAMHLSSPAVWMQNVANGHRGASPEDLAVSFAPRAAVAGSNSSSGYGRGGGGGNNRREHKNGDMHDLATSAESTVDRSSLCETSNGPTFSNGSTERADDSGDEASAVDSALTEPHTDSSQHSLSRDVDSAAASIVQTDPTGYRPLASPPPVQHSLSKIAAQWQDASKAASPAPADESAGNSGNNRLLVGAENLGCSLPRVDIQGSSTSLPRPMRSLSNATADQVGGDVSGGVGSSHSSGSLQLLPVDGDGRHDSTATEAYEIEPERYPSVADGCSSIDLTGRADRVSPTTESRLPAPRIETLPPTSGAATPKASAASGLAEDSDDDDADESQLGERLLIDEERSCGDDADHCSGADENVEGPAGAAATAAVADASASAAEADDAVPPAPKIARLALPE